ncbi:hypothetical protein [Allorhodopirellula heiligendammensis]|uniref:Uncharacterized protein n=1 Tax=Allorhodopirellula heiligendammensis TaxID=2714739 RepID=A0A5C6C0G4_9BACT|nr:hypothetical protein [Allorhodopirellula heiligendammensis]TWU17006.1 hypothetical protein Poly21_42150 [Allorhodopirellula heiligendammensis]
MTQDWDDTDDWDDDDYDEFIQNEFPETTNSNNHLPAIWKWTAWTLLLMIALFWALSL